jgi:hypothetical protein
MDGQEGRAVVNGVPAWYQRPHLRDVVSPWPWRLRRAVLSALLATAIVAGCGEDDAYPETPGGVTTRYLAAVARGDDERAYRLRCDTDQRQQSLAAFKKDTDRLVSDLDGWGDAIVVQVKATGDTAEVSYKLMTGKGQRTGKGFLVRERGRWKICNKP